MKHYVCKLGIDICMFKVDVLKKILEKLQKSDS